MIRHISFDLWLTLIKSNPLFKKRRAELIADTYNPKGLNISQIEILIKRKDKIFDRYNEMKGTKIPAKEMYLNILTDLGSVPRNVAADHAERLTRQANELFIEYPPLLLNDNIPHILNQLNSENKILNIGSNTGFVEGQTLRKALMKLNVFHLFSFCVFSDEVKTSKPSPLFFQQIYDNIHVSKNQVLHIGDNPKTDYRGAVRFGFDALLITDTNYTLNDIKTKL
ncbi:MAG: HAD family hydrolase [Prevotellaceae bacterium]|jgi:putative hydrolase of the HAD superfamily|nr:HAD family hydrolase [Prevotellaceae bacterium]